MTKITDPTEERVIKDKVFRYFLEREDPVRPDQVITVQRLARAGEKVTLRAVDARKGDANGSFFTEEELQAREQAAQEGGAPAPSDAPLAVDLTELDEDEIQAWLEGKREGTKKPSIPQVLSAVNAVEDEEDRAVVAEAVKSAEEAADHDTRSSLIEKLDGLSDEDDDEE